MVLVFNINDEFPPSDWCINVWKKMVTKIFLIRKWQEDFALAGHALQCELVTAELRKAMSRIWNKALR